MKAKILGNVKGKKERFITVHLDTERVDIDGNPHPMYLQNFKYPVDLSEEEYLKALRGDVEQAKSEISEGDLVGTILE